MCGLVGAVSDRNIVSVLIDGLKRFEYRGYDSAGLAFLNKDGLVDTRRCVGRVADLQKNIELSPVSSSIGIAHTRWATHGRPHERNTHPHVSCGEVAVVHNGIVDNHDVLRKILRDDGYVFHSDTDSEVIAHLVHLYLKRGRDLLNAVRETVQHLSGSYAIAVVANAYPDRMIAARQTSPLAIGLGAGQQFVTSDPAAVAAHTQRFMFMEDGDVAEIAPDHVRILDSLGRESSRGVEEIQLAPPGHADKGDHSHFVLKEIFEQPQTLIDILEGRVAEEALSPESLAFELAELCPRIRSVHIVASGSSLHVAELARHWIESGARLPCNAEPASEYCTRAPVVPADCLFVAISQSGETADTLGALHHAQGNGYLATLAVSNHSDSALAREADLFLWTRAGPEIAIPSTKAHTAQMITALMLAMVLARRRWLHSNKERLLVRQLSRLPAHMRAVLELRPQLMRLAELLAPRNGLLLLGRGAMLPVAREGALKLQEMARIPAVAHPAGELKYGPMTLVDSSMPVIALAPTGQWIEKIKISLREVTTRGGSLLVLTDSDSGIEADASTEVVHLPRVDDLLAPILYTMALQLLATEIGLLRGIDIDRPRNLAKAVSVE